LTVNRHRTVPVLVVLCTAVVRLGLSTFSELFVRVETLHANLRSCRRGVGKVADVGMGNSAAVVVCICREILCTPELISPCAALSIDIGGGTRNWGNSTMDIPDCDVLKAETTRHVTSRLTSYKIIGNRLSTILRSIIGLLNR